MGYVDNPGGQVLFASPGMLHAGRAAGRLDSIQSLNRLLVGSVQEVGGQSQEHGHPTRVPPSDRSMHDPPIRANPVRYCVPGTVGARVLSGEKIIDVDRATKVEVKLQVKHLSFSAHADAKGILQLIQQCVPKNVVLVHGEAAKMYVLERRRGRWRWRPQYPSSSFTRSILRDQIVKEFHIGCFHPANGETVHLQGEPIVELHISSELVKRTLLQCTPTPQNVSADFTHSFRAQVNVDDVNKKVFAMAWHVSTHVRLPVTSIVDPPKRQKMIRYDWIHRPMSLPHGYASKRNSKWSIRTWRRN